MWYATASSALFTGLVVRGMFFILKNDMGMSALVTSSFAALAVFSGLASILLAIQEGKKSA